MYRNKTKYPGRQPNLGLQRNGKLARCNYEPNCFSTSGDAAHQLPLWIAPPGRDAMAELVEVIASYPPGQANVDKGGFAIVTARAEYLYVQFESLKFGFVDDVEFAVAPPAVAPPAGGAAARRGSEVQVRSASRVGFLDLMVNAKRLNWISKALRARGWAAPPITKEEYPDYFSPQLFTNDDYIRSVLRPADCPAPSLTCSG